MAVWEGKKYTLERSENYDDFLFMQGMKLFTRKIWSSVCPTVQLAKNGDVYTLNIKSMYRNSILKFKLGVEFEEETIDDRIVKTVMTMEGNKLTQTINDRIPSTIVWDFKDTEIIVTMTVKGITCKRWYKAH